MTSRFDSPPTVFRGFSGPDDTILEMRKAVLGPRGDRSILVRSVAEECVRHLQPKDYLSEILAIRNYTASRLRYQNDPIAVELVKDPQRLVEEIKKHGVAAGDCDDIATLIACLARHLGREAQFVTVGFGKPNHFSHVFARVKEPKSNQWVVTDSVAGTDEGKMLRRVTTWKAWSID